MRKKNNLMIFKLNTIRYFMNKNKVFTFLVCILTIISIVILSIEETVAIKISSYIPTIDIPFFDFKYSTLSNIIISVVSSLIFLYVNTVIASYYKNRNNIIKYKDLLEGVLSDFESFFQMFYHFNYTELYYSNRNPSEERFSMYMRVINNGTSNHEMEYISGTDRLIDEYLITLPHSKLNTELIVDEFVVYRHLRNNLNRISSHLNKLEKISLCDDLRKESEYCNVLVKDCIEHMLKETVNGLLYNPGLFMASSKLCNTYYIKSYALPYKDLHKIAMMIRDEYLMIPIPPKELSSARHSGTHKLLTGVYKI